MADYQPGDVVWADLGPSAGSEQAGHRPVLVVSSELYNESIPNVLIVIPATTSERPWPTRVPMRGPELTLEQRSYAMTEQPRTIDRKRLRQSSGRVDAATLAEVRRNLGRFLDLSGS